MQFINQNPAIGSFQTGVRLGNEERQAADTELRTRMDFENKLLADKGVRQAMLEYYARQQQPAAPAAPAAPAPAAPAPQDAAPAYPMPAPTAPPTPFVASQPATAGVPALSFSRPTSPGTVIQPASGAVPPLRISTTPSGAVPPPASSPAAPAAAAPTAAPAAASAGPRRATGDIGSVISSMVRQPGTGTAALNLFSTDLRNKAATGAEDRKWQTEGAKEWFAAQKIGDSNMMRAIDKHFGLNFPEAVYSDKSTMQSMRVIQGMADIMLKGNDDLRPQFMQSAMHHLASARARGLPSGQAEDEASRLAAADLKLGGPGKAVHWDHAPDNEVVGFDARGRQIRTGVRSRPTAAQGSGGRPSATIQNRDDGVRRLKQAFPGMDDATANKLVMMGGRAHFGPNDYARIASSLAKLTDRTGKPVYRDQAAIAAATEDLVKRAKDFTLGLAPAAEDSPPQPQPQPAAPRPAPAGGPRIQPATAPRLRYNPETDRLE